MTTKANGVTVRNGGGSKEETNGFYTLYVVIKLLLLNTSGT